MSPQWLCVSVVLVCGLLNSHVAATSRPHIVFILADDMGWYDVSYHGSDQIPTPNIDSLAYNGVILNRHYVQPLCTPSRATLMTGKYPIHTGVHDAIYSCQKTGLPTTFKILPQYLKELGYVTRLVGKWHLGFYKKEMTPMQRGYDSHFGYWSGAISYYDHLVEDGIQANPEKGPFSGHDMRRNYSTAWDTVGQYATDLFTEEAVRVIESHSPDTPLFLHLTHLAVHAGNQGKWLEAPQQDIERFQYIRSPNRRTYAAMVSKLDQSVGKVLSALRKKNMLRNSIIVFLSDNGAPCIGMYNNWGSNYPLRGQKATLWEGGVRTPALIWSPLIHKSSRVNNGLMHISDWLPTLLSAAGYNTKSLDVDGLDQWQAISNNYPSPRNEILLDIYTSQQMNALIMGSFKYSKGVTFLPRSVELGKILNMDTIFSQNTPKYGFDQIIASEGWTALQEFIARDMKTKIPLLREEATITCSGPVNISHNPTVDCDNKPCLFNLAADPCEQNNIASKFPYLVEYMDTVLNSYKSNIYPEFSTYADPQSDPDQFNGTWSIWST